MENVVIVVNSSENEVHAAKLLACITPSKYRESFVVVSQISAEGCKEGDNKRESLHVKWDESSKAIAEKIASHAPVALVIHLHIDADAHAASIITRAPLTPITSSPSVVSLTTDSTIVPCFDMPSASSRYLYISASATLLADDDVMHFIARVVDQINQ